MNWLGSDGLVVFPTGPAWLLQPVALPPKSLSEAVPFLHPTIASAGA